MTKWKWDLKGKIITCLSSQPEERMTAKEVAEYIFANYRDDCENKRKLSTRKLDDKKLIQAISAEIGRARKFVQNAESKIKTTGGRPRKYYYSEKQDDIENAEVESTSSGQADEISEHDLYSMFQNFLYAEHGIYGKRINEKRSSNRRGRNVNEWLYPDLVAMEALSIDWEPEIRNIVKECSDTQARLWSFEIKLKINRSNVRRSFFQAVSNSAWANYGYLVAAELVDDDVTGYELQILSALHGIGFILFDIENPPESQILMPAKENPKIDWDTANRLAEENIDFQDFLKKVLLFYRMHMDELKPSNWGIHVEKDDE